MSNKKSFNEHKYEKDVEVRGYRKKDGTYVKAHPSHSVGYEREYDPEWEEKLDEDSELQEKEYHASAGSASVLKKYDHSCKKAIAAGKFDWVKPRDGQTKEDAEYAVCNAAKIGTTGKPTVPRGSHFTKGKGPHGKGRKLKEKKGHVMKIKLSELKKIIQRETQAVNESWEDGVRTQEAERAQYLEDTLVSFERQSEIVMALDDLYREMLEKTDKKGMNDDEGTGAANKAIKKILDDWMSYIM
jgi:hypothetical protein